MMVGHPALALPALLAAAAGGALCAAVALAYAQRIGAGAAVDGAALRAALRAAVLREPAGRVPPVLGACSACLLSLASLPFILQPSLLAGAHAVACAVLLVLAIIDARSGLLPDALTLPLLWAGLLLAWAGQGTRLDDAVAGVIAGYGLLRVLDAGFSACRGRPGLGGGDMKLVAALGAWLGWVPLPAVLLAASVMGIVFAGVGGSRPARPWGYRSLPFGPFLASAGAFGLVGGPVVQFLF